MNGPDASYFKTLSKSDSEFEAYLRGTFSNELMAVPVRTLNVQSQNEEVTFEVLVKKDISRPNFLLVLLKLLRPQTLTFSVGSMVVSFVAAQRMKIPLDFWLSILTIFAVLFFHAAINLLNDYYDHIKGHDRINPNGGSRAIQKAWIPAYQVQRLGFAFFALAVICGVPVLIQHSSLVVVLATLSALAGIEFSTHKLGLKNLGWGEYLVFLLTGPLLTCGFVWATSAYFLWQMLLLGCLFGFVSLLFYHFANIENIFLDSQVHRKTWAVHLGIDRAKKFLWVIAASILLSYTAFAISFALPQWPSRQTLLPEEQRDLLLLVSMFVILAVQLILICVQSNRLLSPLSSDFESIRNRSLRLHWLTVICMILALS